MLSPRQRDTHQEYSYIVPRPRRITSALRRTDGLDDRLILVSDMPRRGRIRIPVDDDVGV